MMDVDCDCYICMSEWGMAHHLRFLLLLQFLMDLS